MQSSYLLYPLKPYLTNHEYLILSTTNKLMLQICRGLIKHLKCTNPVRYTQYPRLQSLDLSNTQITSLFNLPHKLINLNISNCPNIKTIPIYLTNLQHLDLSNDKPLNIGHLAKLKSLILPPSQQPYQLDHLIELEKLHITHPKQEDMEQIYQMDHLKSLTIISTNANNLEPLQNLNLEYLGLHWIEFFIDLEILASMTRLRALTLERVHFPNYACIKTDQLKSLKIIDCQTDFYMVQFLHSLEHIHLTNLQYTDLTQLTNLSNLQTIHLSDSFNHSTEPLDQLEQLQELTLHHWPCLTDLKLPANLTSLSITYCPSLKNMTPIASLLKLQKINLNIYLHNLDFLQNLKQLRQVSLKPGPYNIPPKIEPLIV